MKILLTGGTCYIGSTILQRLAAAGHQVTAVVRSEKASLQVTDAGATAVIGDLYDAEWLAAELAQHEAAIHTAAGSDEKDPALNDAVIDAAIRAFGGTTKPFILTGGIWIYGSNPAITEASELHPPAITGWRPAGEKRLLESDVKASVIQPGIVYGHGRGIAAMLAPDGDTLTLFGIGDQHWTTVHVEDLADLYVLALTNAPGGESYICANGHNPPCVRSARRPRPTSPPNPRMRQCLDSARSVRHCCSTSRRPERRPVRWVGRHRGRHCLRNS